VRILFTTQQRSAVSTVINLKNFSRLAEIAGVHFSAFSDDFASHDVIMFMGYDPQIAEARKMAPHAKIGIVDPRPGTLAACRGADFVIANGPEMTAMASRYVSNIFEYPIYPEVPEVARSDKSNAQVTLTYHGNRAHAVAMFPQVTRALEEVARLVPIRLQIIYNVDQLAPIPERYLPRTPVEVNVINWHEDIYSKELAEADVGLVPNLTPMHSVETALALTTPRDNAFGANPSEVLARYKATSNPGRILSFAQHGVPVIADTFPSASQIIRNGETGFLAFDAFSWYQALRTLCLDEDLRRRMGNNLQTVFRAQFRIADLNRRLVDFLRNQPAVHRPPESLATAQRLFETTDVRSSPPFLRGLARTMLQWIRRPL
jgi:glycosyltransferase involved in cell wall biosynthesis